MRGAGDGLVIDGDTTELLTNQQRDEGQFRL
jgi:hypothetical protein